MSEYVSKKELKEFFESIEITVAGRTIAKAIGEVLQAIYNGVMELPTTDAKPIRHGKWIEKSTGGARFWYCSECGYIEWDAPNNYCQQCGADMRDESNE